MIPRRFRGRFRGAFRGREGKEGRRREGEGRNGNLHPISCQFPHHQSPQYSRASHARRGTTRNAHTCVCEDALCVTMLKREQYSRQWSLVSVQQETQAGTESQQKQLHECSTLIPTMVSHSPLTVTFVSKVTAFVPTRWWVVVFCREGRGGRGLGRGSEQGLDGRGFEIGIEKCFCKGLMLPDRIHHLLWKSEMCGGRVPLGCRRPLQSGSSRLDRASPAYRICREVFLQKRRASMMGIESRISSTQ